ncbi:MAG: beta-glucosidase [Marinilabiliales bacterium]|nr:MAG: beta-glucosidase [Marinilabiliales bacterium]
MIIRSDIYAFILLFFLVSCGREHDDDIPGENGNNDNDVSEVCPPLSRVIAEEMPLDELLDKVQMQTLKYFWDFAEPVSGMARERNTSGNLVTTGGTGFGIMAMIAGAEREFIGREDVLERVLKIGNFLFNAERYHGAWAHWIDGTTGKTIPFSEKDNGGDLVETAFLVQGLLSAREYFDGETPLEDSLRALIDTLWHGVDWQWYTRGENVLYWHWSPEYEFEINLPVRGWNEALIVYILAAASPTYPVSPEVYHHGWARNGDIVNGRNFYNIRLPLGVDFGGPLFFAHYSFMGLDPRGLNDSYADYWEQNRSHSLINHRYCIANPKNFCHYSDSLWGITASDDPEVGYQAHAPFGNHGTDNGTIAPTAALSSMPYTPEESRKALNTFYYYLYDDLWGNYGFRDAFNFEHEWFAGSYLAIDQGPIVVMIENYRSGLLWDVFMRNEHIHRGLDALGFYYD